VHIGSDGITDNGGVGVEFIIGVLVEPCAKAGVEFGVGFGAKVGFGFCALPGLESGKQKP
jgi:hypothetical protein